VTSLICNHSKRSAKIKKIRRVPSWRCFGQGSALKYFFLHGWFCLLKKAMSQQRNMFSFSRLVDPFGHVWIVASVIEEVSDEKLLRRIEALM
jgi:hypothetical protein